MCDDHADVHQHSTCQRGEREFLRTYVQPRPHRLRGVCLEVSRVRGTKSATDRSRSLRTRPSWRYAIQLWAPAPAVEHKDTRGLRSTCAILPTSTSNCRPKHQPDGWIKHHAPFAGGAARCC